MMNARKIPACGWVRSAGPAETERNDHRMPARKAKVLAVTSGKGGVGKSTMTVSLGIAAAASGSRVLLIELDAGLRGMDIMLGISDRIVFDLGDLLEGRCNINSAIIPSPNVSGLYAIVAPVSMTGPILIQDMRLLIDGLRAYFDLIILDTPAGLGRGLRIACEVSDLALIIATPDPVCIRDGNQVVREMLSRGFTSHRLIINRVSRKFIRYQVVRDLDEVIDGVGSQLIGVVPEDGEVTLFSSHGRLPDPKGELQRVCRAIIARIDGEYKPLIVR